MERLYRQYLILKIELPKPQFYQTLTQQNYLRLV